MKKVLLVLLSILSLTCFLTACNENNNEVCSHSYSEWNIVDEATCLEDGLKSHTCSKCGEVETQIVEALGHMEVVDARVEPTCISTGLTEGKHCSSCNTVLINQETLGKLEHIEVTHEAKAPTCGNVGWSEYITCERQGCQYSTYNEIPATENHIWDSGEITTQPTCTKKGIKTFTCTTCGTKTKTEDVKELGHDEVTHQAKAPTCANVGWDEYLTCERDSCNYSTYNEIPATGNHTWNDGEITTQPTCTKKGIKLYTCSKCIITTKTENIKALGHTEIIDNGVDPTCISTGLTVGKHCSICKAVLVQQKIINKINHNYVNGACSVCSTVDISFKNTEIENEKTRHNNEIIEINTFYESTIEALEERIENLKLLNNITSVYSDSYCYSMINSLNSEIATLERKIAVLSGSTNSADIAERRKYESQLSAKQQESDNYYKHIAINDCIMQINEYKLYWKNDIENENQTHVDNLDKIEKKYYCAANGHTIIVDEAIEPTCTVNGRTKGSHCSYCETILIHAQTISATGHNYGDWAEVLSPTCETSGKEERTCSKCFDVEQNILSALGHTWSDWKQFKIPDCTSPGQNIRECFRCKSNDYQTVEVEHDRYVYNIITPTCSSVGYTTYKCHNCDYSSNENQVPTVEHNYINIISNIDPTCIEFGDIIKECQWCTKRYHTKPVPTEHNFVNNICTKCEQQLPTAGLEYSIGSWTSPNCECSGIGTATETTIIISDTNPHIGSPVGDKTYYYPNTGIADKAFENCTNIECVIIPKTIVSIGSYAFSGCTNLKTVIIPDGVTTIGSYAFYGCSSLESIVIPASLISIDDYTFAGCTSLKTVVITDNITSIGKAAFGGCIKLETINISNNLTLIGESAFYNTAYFNNENNWENGILYLGDYLIRAKTSITGTYTIKDGTKLLANKSFYNCSNLTGIKFPSSMHSISERAFDYCSSLTTITIPNTITSIGYYAFHACTSLERVTIPSSVTLIDGSFADCFALSSVTFETTWSWKIYPYKTSTTGTSISSSSLSNKSTAATYFKQNGSYCWKRG